MTRTSHLPMPAWRHILAAGGVILVLGACSAIGSKPPQLYTLQAPAVEANDIESLPAQLAIAVPDAPANLDSTRIALSQSATTTDYFANAEWTDRAPILIQNLLIESFENSGKIKAVFRDTAALHADYLLQTEIRNFEAQYSEPHAAPQVVVRIESRLLRMPDRNIVGTFNATEQTQAEKNNVDSIVTAFNAALGAALQQTVAWTLHTLPAKPEKKRRRMHKRTPPAQTEAQPQTPPQTKP
jgi:cholesterol transport system auxiliary component